MEQDEVGSSPLLGTAQPGRQHLINAAKRRDTFSVLIIGAGINGLGIFWDLSMQGIDCLLVDKGDFCSGTSGASSRVIHGGLKYLETGEFRLVRESTVERNRLIRNAPHVVHPIEIVLLFHSWFGGSIATIKRFFGRPAPLGGRGAVIVELGLCLFDFLGLKEKATRIHRCRSRKSLRRMLPDIEAGMIGGAIYHDATISLPERLALELAIDAMTAGQDHIPLNYVSVMSADGRRVLLRDEISNAVFHVQPRVVVNTTGAWIDDTNRAIGICSTYVRGTKGSHVVLDHPFLFRQIAGRMVSFDASDGRECFAYPLLDKILLGTTDVYVGDVDEAHCENEEVRYLLDALQTAFPGLRVSTDDVVFAYSGVRPLPNVGASDPSQVSRYYSIRVDEPYSGRQYPVLSLVGGKWTTFRAAAERATNEVLRRLRRDRKTQTKDTAIGGGRDFPTGQGISVFLVDLMRRHGLTRGRAELLVQRYGTKATAVALFCSQAPDEPIANAVDYTKREIVYIATNEMVTRLADIILRRTTIAVRGQATRALLEEVSTIVSGTLGWNAARKAAEIDHMVSLLRRHHVAILDLHGYDDAR